MGLIHSEDRIFFLREHGGPLKDTGKWKCVFTKKTMFQNKDLGRQLSGDKVSSHKLVLEGHISVLSFPEDFGSQAMLSHTLLSSPGPRTPLAGAVPAAAGPHCRTASRKGPKLTVPTPQIILRLSKH